MLGPAEIGDPRTRRRHVEPQRVRHARIEQTPPLVRRQRLRIARIERRAVGIARPGRLRLALRHQPCNLGAAFERGIDQAHAPRVSPARRDSPRGAPTAAAPAFPMRSRARRGPRRSRPRIPAGSAPDRYPRCAAASGHRCRARRQNSAAPNRRGRDADSRSGSARSGKRVAALYQVSSWPGLSRSIHVLLPLAYVPAIHVLQHDVTLATTMSVRRRYRRKTWMAGTSPAMTK